MSHFHPRTGAFLLIMLAALILSACTNQADKAPQTDTQTINHPAGTAQIPLHPQRVASDQYMGHLLKLGIKPVGVRENMLIEAWIPHANLPVDALEGIEDLGGFPLNLEKLSLLEPDLIISSLPTNQEAYEKIAPTVHVPYLSDDYMTVNDKLLRLAQLFNKTDVAETWITDFGKQADQLRQKIIDSGKIKEGDTVSVMAVFDKNVYLFGPNGSYGGYILHDVLGLPATTAATELLDGKTTSLELAMETVPDYMGDHAFITVVNEDKAKELLESAFWQSIPAVQNEQIYFYDSKVFAMDDPYSQEAQLQVISDLMFP